MNKQELKKNIKDGLVGGLVGGVGVVFITQLIALIKGLPGYSNFDFIGSIILLIIIITVCLYIIKNWRKNEK